MMKKRPSYRERLRYIFDQIMSIGTLPLVGILFSITALVGILVGIIASFDSGEQTITDLIWLSFMNILDAGNLTDAKSESVPIVVLMVISTLCGLFITSILVGIIVSGFEEKLYSLRQGFSRVVESGHMVIIGFNDNLYTILQELIEANANKKNARIVVIDPQGKEYIDEQIRLHIADTGTTKIITRSGSYINPIVLQMASLETCEGIIINLEDDAATIKAILSVTTYLKESGVFNSDTRISALIRQQKNLEAALIAGCGQTEIVYTADALARIIANTCREPGLSAALLEMLSFSGDELYFERFPELDGLRFREVLNLFEQSTVMGLFHNGKQLLNPPMDMLIMPGDSIIHLASDDKTSFPQKPGAIAAGLKQEAESLLAQSTRDFVTEKQDYQVLILGCNDWLPQILLYIDDFAAEGSKVVIAAENLPEENLNAAEYRTLSVGYKKENIYDLKSLQQLLIETGLQNILLLNNFTEDDDSSDAKTILLLLLLKKIAEQLECDFNITSEMRLPENQRLILDSNVSDFVVGSTIQSLLLAQISQNKHIYGVFRDMLDEEGSELYFRPAANYIDLTRAVSCHALTELAAERGEIFLGYKKLRGSQFDIAMNIPKSQYISFESGDSILVIAEN